MVKKEEGGFGSGGMGAFGQVEAMDTSKIEEALAKLELIDSEKEANKISQEEHDVKSKEVLETLENSTIIHSPIKKYMKTTSGKKRVTMARSDGIRQHYWMNPEDIKAYKAKGRDVQEVQTEEPDKDKTVAVDFDGTIVDLNNPDQLMQGAKEGLQEIADLGYTIIIFSGRGTKDLEQRLAKLGIDTYDYINDNPEERQDNPGKVVADKYIDDKGIEFKGDWKEAISKLKEGDNMQVKKEVDPKEEMQEEMEEESEQVPPEITDSGEIAGEMNKFLGFGKKKTESTVPPLQSASSGRPNPKSVRLMGPKTGTPPKSESDMPSERLSKEGEAKQAPREIPGTKAPKTREYLKSRGLLKDGEEQTYPYLEAHLKDAVGILDKCPTTKDLSRTEKMQIVQDTLTHINPVQEEEMGKEDPMEEIKAMLNGLVEKLSAMEVHIGQNAPASDIEKDGLVVHPTKNYNLTMPTLPIKDDKASEREEASRIEKAEPVKTLPVYQGQKKQEDKILGGDDSNKITKEDAEKIIIDMLANKTKTVASPIKKEEKFDMHTLAKMSFEQVNEMSSKMIRNRVV